VLFFFFSPFFHLSELTVDCMTESENRGYMAEYYKKLLEKQANEGKA
jgi:hypothetical protein